ncbi:MAG: 50S ribosomal protein L3 N(5)-glutamine methyltransferase [Parvularculaceae bacterium]
MTDALATVRDFFRYAATEFTRTELFFGHGSDNAIDEAAFLVLETLSLPIDDINPWLDARLTAPERARMLDLIEKRVSTRKPAAYLLNKAYLGGAPFYVDERVLTPRSYIAEILVNPPAFFPNAEDVYSVLDLCTGSGCLAILAAHAFPNATVAGADVSADALKVAARNVADYGLETRVALKHGDLFAPLHGEKFDLIITNPPYVDAEAMSSLPAEFRAEPALALAAGDDGMDVVRRIIKEAPGHLNAGGGLLCEFGTGREILERDYPDTPFLFLDSETSEGEMFWLTCEDFPAPAR